MNIMNCTDFNKVFDDCRDGELDAAMQAECDAHRASCADCAARWQADEAMLSGLRALPVQGPSEGFVDRALHTAMQRNVAHHHRHGFLVGFSSALAAALALWVVVGWLPGEMPTAGPGANTVAGNGASQAGSEAAAIPELSIALNEQRDIKLAFYSGQELKGAKITIQVPDNVALVGYPGRRELSWKANLVKGDNTLRLPVLATQIASGELIANIRYGKQSKTLKVRLSTSAANHSGQLGTQLRVG
jgi:hypothetical protein